MKGRLLTLNLRVRRASIPPVGVLRMQWRYRRQWATWFRLSLSAAHAARPVVRNGRVLPFKPRAGGAA